MRLELPNDLPTLANDADPSIVGTEEETIRTGADARYFVALEQLLGLVVGEGNLGDVEEVERLPLDRCVSMLLRL